MRTLLKFVFALLVCSTAAAVEPSIRSLNIRGLQIGGTTELVCDGDDFTTESKLLLPFAVEQSLKAGSTEKRATFTVTLADNIEPGYYQLRVTTAGGVSQPIVIGVDRLPQQELKTPIEKLPVAVHGSVSGSGIVETKFSGKEGESVTVEIEAQRFGSKLRPVIHLYDPKGKQLAWAWPQPSLFGDARLEATLPADGEYRVTCHDLEYAAGNPSFFRLRFGEWTRVEQIYPAVIGLGPATPLEVKTTTTTLQVTVSGAENQTTAFLPVTPTGVSGPRPFVRVTRQREILETAAQGLSLAAGPVGISGTLPEVGDEDRFSLAVQPGDKIRMEVLAQRAGSVIDARLIVRNESGAVLAQGDDSLGSLDPVLEYVVPDKVQSIRICVVDSQGRGGLGTTYHLTLRNLNDAAASTGDGQLLTSGERMALPPGGRWLMPVWFDRRALSGAIELTAQGLPAGITLANATIQPGSSGTLVTLIANDAEPTALAAITHWQGKFADGQSQPVVVRNHPLSVLQPWLAEEIAIARVNPPAADFSIGWRDLPETAALKPTVKLLLPVKITRAEEKSAVRLSLVSSQFVTLGNNNQPDPNKTLRVERAVELGAKMNDGELSIVVPSDLAEDAYDLAVQAELLSADKQKVLATAFTPVRRLPVLMPVELQLAGEPKIDVTLDPAKGAMQKIEGTLKRRDGITGDVTIALAGLPAGARADSPVVKADASTFSVNVVLPANQPAGEIAGLKLSATIVPDPKQANARVKSREVEITLNVVRP